MKIRVHEMYYPDDEGPYEEDLEEQIRLDVEGALDKNAEVFRDAVLRVCPQATVIPGKLEIEDINFSAGRGGSRLTASIRYPVAIALPAATSEKIAETIDSTVAGLEPIPDRHKYLQGLEWMSDWDDKVSYDLIYALEGQYKNEDW